MAAAVHDDRLPRSMLMSLSRVCGMTAHRADTWAVLLGNVGAAPYWPDECHPGPMPKRTNDFPQLVAMLAGLLGEGAVVEESRMLTEVDSDNEREVDVCIEGMFAGHHTLIGIECRDHKRKQDVTFVEAMHAKHSRLPTAY